jgi:hypothetical protein
MEPNVVKKFGKWFCKCGKNITKEKLYQLIDSIKETLRYEDYDWDKDVEMRGGSYLEMGIQQLEKEEKEDGNNNDNNINYN